MDIKVRRYSRILIPLPPIEKIIEIIKNRVEKDSNIIPEYIQTPDIEGFAISWPAWYGYSPKIITYSRASKLRNFFENSFMDFTGEDETPIIEIVDKDNWWYIDNSLEIGNEVYSNRYYEGENYIDVYKDFLRFNIRGRAVDYKYSEFTPNFIDYNANILIMKKSLKKNMLAWIF